jgi:hypothetical protein
MAAANQPNRSDGNERRDSDNKCPSMVPRDRLQCITSILRHDDYLTAG